MCLSFIVAISSKTVTELDCGQVCQSPGIPAIRGPWQNDPNLEMSLGYKARPCLKKQKQKTTQHVLALGFRF